MARGKASRVFSGRKYRLEAGPHLKGRAQSIAKDYRKRGYLARLIPYESRYHEGYLIYVVLKGR